MRQSERVCIVGLGYVGVTLAVILADKGFNVTGIDRDENVIDSLKRGKPHLFEPGVDELLQKYINSRIFVQNSLSDKVPSVVVICVSTPIHPNTKKPLLDNLVNACKDIGERLVEKTLVIVRSTVPVGTSRNVVLPILRGKTKDVRLAFCPERTIQGQAVKELQKLPQIIGGLNAASARGAAALFQKITPAIVPVSSLEAAEMIKLICNCHTDLIYSYGNEVALMAEKFGLDPIELIKSANLDYPRPDLNLPGFVGGGCLSKDPYILMSSFQESGYTPTLVKSARKLNESMPVYMADKVLEKLKSLGKDVKKAKVLIAGFAYKGFPLTDDLRGTPARPFVDRLRNYVKHIYGHDFIVSEARIAEFGVSPCSIEEGFREADCAVFLNNHPSYRNLDIARLANMMKKPALIVDSWRLFDLTEMREFDGLTYMSIGL